MLELVIDCMKKDLIVLEQQVRELEIELYRKEDDLCEVEREIELYKIKFFEMKDCLEKISKEKDCVGREVFYYKI